MNMHRTLPLVLGGILSPAALADVIHVWPDAPGPGIPTGMTWGTAFHELYQALWNAAPGDQIWIAAGTYKPFPGGDFTFDLVDGVSIFGGMPPGASSVDDQDVDGEPTILSADHGVIGDASDNAPTVLRAMSVSGVLVDGVTIEGGYSAGTTDLSEMYGGGAYLLDSNVRFVDCTFEGNTAVSAGGAIAAMGNSTFLASRCKFFGNNAGLLGGGAVFVAGEQLGESEGYLERCRLQSNYARIGGAIDVAGRLEAFSCLMIGNRAETSGGAIHVHAGQVPALLLVNATIARNEAMTAQGGGIHSETGDAAVLNSILWGNTAALPLHGPKQAFPTNGFRIEHSLVEGLVTGPASIFEWTAPGNENLSEPPRFLDWKGPDGIENSRDDDYRLSLESPCADTGDQTFYPTGWPLQYDKDLLGRPRVIRSTLVAPAPPLEIDMGAYEIQPRVRFDSRRAPIGGGDIGPF